MAIARDQGYFANAAAGSAALKRWTGAAWIKAKLQNKAVAGWESRPVKRWNGAAWIDVDGLGG